MLTDFDYKYKEYKFIKEDLNNLLVEFFKNKEELKQFIDIINTPNVYLSGSSLLKFISKDDFRLNDLDIYIDISKFKDGEIKDLLRNLQKTLHNLNYYNNGKDFNLMGLNKRNGNKFLARYVDYKTTRRHKKLFQKELGKFYKQEKNIPLYIRDHRGRNVWIKDNTYMVKEPTDKDIEKLKNKEINKLIKKNVVDGSIIYNQMKVINKKIDIHKKSKLMHQNNTNYCLRGHLLDYYNYSNINKRKNIEIMFISKPIDQFMLTTFDLSIVQNYYSNGKIYSNSLDDIENKEANISLDHFKNRILYSKHEFNNFLTRFEKYTNRGYTIKVGGANLSKDDVEYIKLIRLDKISPFKYDYNYNTRKTYIMKYIIVKYVYQQFKSREKALETQLFQEQALETSLEQAPETINIQSIFKNLINRLFR